MRSLPSRPASSSRTSLMLRLGIVDFDSSHAVEFARRFNHVGVTADQFVDGAKVVAGWPGSSQMAPERIPGFTKDVAAAGVELVDSSAALMDRIDAVLILSLAGDAHLERVRPFLEAGIPAYVDKPFACSAGEANEMVRLSREHSVLMWQGSAVRFCSDVTEYKASWDQLGPLNGAVSFGPASGLKGTRACSTTEFIPQKCCLPSWAPVASGSPTPASTEPKSSPAGGATDVWRRCGAIASERPRTAFSDFMRRASSAGMCRCGTPTGISAGPSCRVSKPASRRSLRKNHSK